MQADKPIFAIVVTEKGGGERREVFQAAELSVGRVQGNDLTLPKGNVSKRHARLIFRDGRFIITDLNSTNGTYVNRRRITQATIVHEGDRIYIGDFVLRVESATEEDTGAVREGRVREAPQHGPGLFGRPKVSLRSGGGRGEQSGAGGLASEPTSSPSLVVGEGANAATLQPKPEATGEADAPQFALSASPGEEVSQARYRETPWDPAERDSMAEEERTLSAAQRAVRTLIERVHESLAPGALDKDVDERLAARFLTILQEQFDDLVQDGELPAEVPAERVLADARAELLELGPVTRLLSDPRVVEVRVLRFDLIYAVFDDHVERSESVFSSNLALVRAIGRVCQKSGTPLRPDEECVWRLLPEGIEVHAVLGGVAPTGVALSLRRVRTPKQTLAELVEGQVLSGGMAQLLEVALKAGLRVLVVGTPSVGTASLMSALSRAGAAEGVVAVQGVDDWVLGHPSATKLAVDRDSVGFSEVVAFARSLAPRVIVDMRDGERAVDIILACDSRPLTGYLPDARVQGALARLVPLVAAHRAGMAPSSASALVAASFDLVVEAGVLDAKFRVTRIAEVIGAAAETVMVGDAFVYERTAAPDGGFPIGQFRAGPSISQVIDALIRRGADPLDLKGLTP